jgi:glycosyltransferase involved in cell wall biosynthesis
MDSHDKDVRDGLLAASLGAVTASVQPDDGALAACGESSDVHIFNPFKNFFGGSERAAMELARDIRRHAVGVRVRLWRMGSSYDRRCDAEEPVHYAHPLRFPLGGTFIFVGAYWNLKPWITLARPRRVRVVVNTNDMASFRRLLPAYRRMSADLGFVFRSRLQRNLHGIDGPVRPSSINLDRFHPAPVSRAHTHDAPFTVGRVSRDAVEKHHYLYDPELYRTLAREDFRFRVMGGTCLEPLIAGQPNIELLPAGAVDAAEFYRSLDCFFFRTGTFYDTFARVVFEAMACGLPVVCDRFGGYAEHIQHGRNGLLFDGQQQAMELLREVRRNRELRLELGAKARRTAERLFNQEAARRRVVELLT